MIHQSDRALLERFSIGESTPEEESYIRSLFDEQEESHWLKDHLHTTWNAYLKETPAEQQELSHLLDRVHHIIHNREKQREKKLVRKLFRWYSMAAAVLIIPLLIAGGMWIAVKGTQPVKQVERVTSTLVAPMGSRIAFTLPDGTKGWLNSGSCLEYSLPFADERKVSLRGEAWFDVSSDEMHSFEVTAGQSKIKVLGTKFNLNAYPAENYVEVALQEGKVEFTSADLPSPLIIEPNERLIYRNREVRTEWTDAAKYAAWVEGKLVFRGDPMPEVARRLERWYNVKVEIMDKDLENDVIRGTFQDDTLEEVLRLLSMTTPIRYRIMERKVLPDGTFEKGRVMLYRKKIGK